MRPRGVWLRLVLSLAVLLALGVATGQASTMERAASRGAALVADTPDSAIDQGDGRDAPDTPTFTWVALVALVVLGMGAGALWRLTTGAGDGTSSPFRSGGEPCRAPPAWRLL